MNGAFTLHYQLQMGLLVVVKTWITVTEEEQIAKK